MMKAFIQIVALIATLSWGCGTKDDQQTVDVGHDAARAPDTNAPDSGGAIDASTADIGSTTDTRLDVDLGPLGGDRPAEVVLPQDWTPTGSYPVVVLLHGLGANSTLQNAFFRTSLLVDELQFVLVLPEGTRDSTGRQFWNASEFCCDFEQSGVDDSTYLIQLAQDALDRYAGDPTRLYFMGHSNGGYMSYRLACDHSERIAAIASLAGSSWLNPADCGDPVPVGVLQIHGTADLTVAYDGGYYQGMLVQPGAEEIVARWVERNGCSPDPVFVGSADYDTAAAGAETNKDAWRDCADGTEVQLWRMVGSGHIPATGQQFTRDLLAFLFEHRRL